MILVPIDTSRRDGSSINRLTIQANKMIFLEPPLSQSLFQTSVSGNANALLNAIKANAIQLL